jgi:hypothetical protein
MITVPGLASEALGSYLSTHLGRRFHSTEAQTAMRFITTSSIRCS